MKAEKTQERGSAAFIFFKKNSFPPETWTFERTRPTAVRPVTRRQSRGPTTRGPTCVKSGARGGVWMGMLMRPPSGKKGGRGRGNRENNYGFSPKHSNVLPSCQGGGGWVPGIPRRGHTRYWRVGTVGKEGSFSLEGAWTTLAAIGQDKGSRRLWVWAHVCVCVCLRYKECEQSATLVQSFVKLEAVQRIVEGWAELCFSLLSCHQNWIGNGVMTRWQKVSG